MCSDRDGFVSTVLSFVLDSFFRLLSGDFIKLFVFSLWVSSRVSGVCQFRRIMAKVDILNNLGRYARGLKGDLLILGRVKPNDGRITTSIRESRDANNDTNPLFNSGHPILETQHTLMHITHSYYTLSSIKKFHVNSRNSFILLPLIIQPEHNLDARFHRFEQTSR